jgi:hypothetical protein
MAPTLQIVKNDISPAESQILPPDERLRSGSSSINEIKDLNSGEVTSN